MDIFQNLAVDLDTEGELETLLVHAMSNLTADYLFEL